MNIVATAFKRRYWIAAADFNQCY